MSVTYATEGNTGERSHVAVKGREVVDAELRELVVPARAGQYLHELDCRVEESRETLRRLVDRKPGAQVRLLGCDTDRAVVGVASPHPKATDGLNRAVGDRDRVGSERKRFGEVGRVAQPTRDDERDVTPAAPVEMPPGPRQRRDCRH